MIGVLHMGLGNVGSLCQCLKRLGKDYKILTEPDFSSVDQLLFPGVGNFAKASEILDQGWRVAIDKWLAEGKSLIGICLGFQLMFTGSEEAPGAKGLGVFDVDCHLVPSNKVPHMGWNRLISKDEAYKEFEDQWMYFVHSFAPPLCDDSILTAKDGGDEFTVAVWKEGVGGFQFHPEKSSDDGQKILQSFLEKVLC